MTYRYLKLFCCKDGTTPSRRALDGRSPAEHDAETCFIDHFIRNESLEEDLIAGLEANGHPVPEAQRTRLFAHPGTNMSHHKRRIDFYYDAASIDLVAKRDSLIVKKFGYQPK